MQESLAQIRFPRHQRIEHARTLAPVTNQARVAQGREVPGDSGLREPQSGLQVADAQRAAPQELQNIQPHGFAGRFEQMGEIGSHGILTFA
jgi:hypothetical protein